MFRGKILAAENFAQKEVSKKIFFLLALLKKGKQTHKGHSTKTAEGAEVRATVTAGWVGFISLNSLSLIDG